jgi:hypothetical protein
MTTVPTAREYHYELGCLLAQCRASLTDEQQRVLRDVVRARRNWRPNREQTPVPAAISRHADEIVQLLESAAQVLRPRETQVLDDLVAGKEPVVQQPTGYNTPVRLHRRGSS